MSQQATPLPADPTPVNDGSGITIQVERDDAEELVLTLIGQIRFDTAQFVSAPVNTRLAASPVRRLVLDCRQVIFVDSQALVMLLTLSRTCRNQGGELVIRNPLPIVQNLLRVTKLDSLFVIEEAMSDPPPMARIPLSFNPQKP